jgi:AraC-like DNA-binding protein
VTTATRPKRPTRGTSRPQPPHGTTARAKGRPQQGIPACPCPRCRAAECRYANQRTLRILHGQPLTHPAEPITQHLRALKAAGAGWLQLQAATGCSSSTLHDILHGRVRTVRSATARRLLALKPGDAKPSATRNPVGAIGSIRRIRALTAIGHSCKTIAAHARVGVTVVRDLLNGRLDTVTRGVADGIAAAYRRLVRQPGTCARARTRAATEGWHGPMAWGDDMDDPAAQPETDSGTEQLKRDELAALRREEILHLARFGIAEREIAARLGMRRGYVHDLLRDMREAA